MGAFSSLALLLSGCAAGSSAIVAPTPADVASEAVIAVPEAPAPEIADAAPGQDLAVEPDAEIVSQAPEGANAASVAAPAGGSEATAPENGRTVAFAQEVPVVEDSAELAPADVVATGVDAPAPPAMQAPRLAPPPAPGDGTILDYYRGPSGRLEVALTLDAGAGRGYAEQILDELAVQGIPATFGMTGKWAQENPDLIQRMVAEGHQLINHTWSHGSLTGASTGGEPITYDALLTELTDTENLIRDLTGYELKPYFRPPYGDIGPITSGYLAQAGYYINVLWSCDSFGWKGFGADEIVQRCTSPEMGGPGAIILMHVGADAVGDFEALPGLIGYYRGQGYAFVTVEQMLQP